MTLQTESSRPQFVPSFALPECLVDVVTNADTHLGFLRAIATVHHASNFTVLDCLDVCLDVSEVLEDKKTAISDTTIVNIADQLRHIPENLWA
jgi:hypothetical protein